MVRAASLRIFFSPAITALVALGCSDSSRISGTPTGDASGSRADSTAMTGGDGSTTNADGGGATSDGSMTNTDSGMTRTDSGTSMGSDSGSSTGSDGGAIGGACGDLLACCGQVPAQIQGVCMSTANGGDQMRCQQIIDLAAMFGVMCGTPSGSDGGAMSGDAGPLGPVCTEYLACCPSLGPAQGLCESRARMGNEATCTQDLQAAQNAGQCGGDGGGFSFDGTIPDFGPFPSPDASAGDGGAGD